MQAPEYQRQAVAQPEADAPASTVETRLHGPVLFVTTSFPLHEKSTSGTFIKALVDALGDFCALEVVTPADTRTLPVPGPEHRYKLHAFRYAPRRWQKLAHQPGGIPAALRRRPLLFLLLSTFLSRMLVSLLFEGRKAALIHANWSVSGALAGIAGSVLEKPVITTLRGSDVALAMRSRLFRALLKLCVHLSACVVTVSEAMAASVKKIMPDQTAKVVTIPNGVSEEFLDIAPRPERTDSPLQLVTIGNLTANKSISTLIEAVHCLRDKADLQLRVIGDGPERARLEARIQQLGLREHVSFEGTLPPDEIPEALAGTDVLILASQSEGRPNVVLEAMAAGRAVIASNIEGTRELITDAHNGLLFSPGDVDALAERIEQVYKDPGLCDRLGKAARQTILDQQLTWPSTARRYYRLYEELVGPESARAAEDY